MDTVIKICKCGKSFESPRWAHRKYCSQSCCGKFRAFHLGNYSKGKTPWNKGKKGLQTSYRKGKTWASIWGTKKSDDMKMNLRRKKYKGSININHDGYYRKRCPNTGKELLVHQQVWKDNNLGYIPKGFLVHHLDGNKLNNHKDNLLLLDFKIHSKLHHTGMKHSEASKIKMSLNRKGRIFTEEHKNNISKAKRRSK